MNLETIDSGHAADALRIPVWTWLIVAFALFAIYAMLLENGAILQAAANTLHEFFHDGRHFLGVPCH